ncbi:hypothetical protein SAMN04515674_101461 [Pseudarcicella hirudinis]|uniref:Uncharacterized protein n=1 Tax=Pseudarcicella hirudinis TaxID=1079859 RepID=A0A1I5MV37_9BACT|nr:hypothetical protein [Pseudarcicella hirudinis]SFP13404.1 hypothetical protein SAMN04515674_101461 [Pseudarcicella hirudinis]
MRFSRQYQQREVVLAYNAGVNVGVKPAIVYYKGLYFIALFDPDGTHVTILGKEGVVSRLAGTPQKLNFINSFVQNDVDQLALEATVTGILGAGIVNTSVLISTLTGLPLSTDGYIEPVTTVDFEVDSEKQALVLQLGIYQSIVQEAGLGAKVKEKLNRIIAAL